MDSPGRATLCPVCWERSGAAEAALPPFQDGAGEGSAPLFPSPHDTVMLSEGGRPSRNTLAQPDAPNCTREFLSGADGFSRKSHALPRVFGKVLPARVDALDYGYLLRAPPSFQLLLPADGLQNVVEALIVDQAMAVIFAGKSRNFATLVLQHATGKTAGHTNI